MPVQPESHCGSISVRLELTDFKSAVDKQVNQTGQAVQNAGLEHAKSSQLVDSVEEANQLTSTGGDFIKSLGAVLLKIDPIMKIIDDVSRVSRSSLFHNLAIDWPTRFIPSPRLHRKRFHWCAMYDLLFLKTAIVYENGIQAVLNQIKLDKKVVELSETLKEAFTFVDDANKLHSRTRLLEHHITKLL